MDLRKIGRFKVSECEICGELITHDPKKIRKYCGAVCAAIANARRMKLEYVDTLTVEQAKHWYRSGRH